MSLRRKSSHRSSRRDPSAFKVPAAVAIVATAVAGGVSIVSPDQLVLNPLDGANPVSGITIDGLPVLAAEQTDPFTIVLHNAIPSGVVVPTVMIIEASMQGIRTIRGGPIAIGRIDF